MLPLPLVTLAMVSVSVWVPTGRMTAAVRCNDTAKVTEAPGSSVPVWSETVSQETFLPADQTRAWPPMLVSV